MNTTTTIDAITTSGEKCDADNEVGLTSYERLDAAKEKVSEIRERDIAELRNLARPPANAKLILVCTATILTGKTNPDWGDVRIMLSKPDFIARVLDFDVAQAITKQQADHVRKKCFDGTLSYEDACRSSKACAPLYQWMEALMSCADYL